MALINARNNLGQFPVGSVVGYDFGAPADTRWLETDGSAISTTTYSDLYDLVGYEYEGTGNLTSKDEITASSGKSGYFVEWHPSSNYVACSTDVSGHEVMVASFNGTTLTEVAYADLGSRSFSAGWHPDGNFLAVATFEGHLLKVLSWNGSNTLTEVESVDITYGGMGISWHPDGDFLAVAHAPGGTDEIEIFSWNGTDTLTSVETLDYGAQPNGADWSPDGDYLAVPSNLASNQVQIYSWNGSDTLTSVCSYDYGAGNYLTHCDWSADGTFIACGGSKTSNQIVILSFNGTSLTERETVALSANYFSGDLRWSGGGNYLIASSYYYSASGSDDGVILFSWSPSTYTLTEDDAISETQGGSRGAGFNYTNNYFAYTGYNTTVSPYNILYAGTTGLTSCDYMTNFLLPITTDSIIRAL